MRHCIIAVSLAVLFAGTNAAADARQHFLAGQDYYSQGRYEKAIEEFQEAYRLEAKPKLLFNIAQSYEKLGDLKETIAYLERYLKEDPNTDDQLSIKNKIANLKARIAVTGFKVTCNEAGADIYVDDKKAGTTPVSGVISIGEGTHKIKISKLGFKDFIMSVAVSEGQSVSVDATLESDGTRIDTGDVADKDQSESSPAQEEEKGGSGFMNALPWIVTGVGAATAVVGWAVVGTIAKNAQPDENDPDYFVLQNEAHKKAVIADVMGIAGAAIAAGGATWGIIRLATGGSDDKQASVKVVPFADGHQAGLSASFTF